MELKNKFAPTVKYIEFRNFLFCREFVEDFLNAAVNTTHIKLSWIHNLPFWNWRNLNINYNVKSVAYTDFYMNRRDSVLQKYPNVHFVRIWDMKFYKHAFLDITWDRENGVFHPIKVYMTGAGIFPSIVKHDMMRVTHLAIMASPFPLIQEFLNDTLPVMNNLKQIEITIRGRPSNPDYAARRLQIVQSNVYIQRVPEQLLSIDNNPPRNIHYGDYPQLPN
jgi:hypothetical protein